MKDSVFLLEILLTVLGVLIAVIGWFLAKLIKDLTSKIEGLTSTVGTQGREFAKILERSNVHHENFEDIFSRLRELEIKVSKIEGEGIANARDY